MKFNKKISTLGAFILGAVIFTSTAMADVIIGSGYNRLKDTAKKTAAVLTRDVSNFEANVTCNLVIDGETYFGAENNMKYDIANKRLISIDKSLTKDEGERTNFIYRDSEKNITKNYAEDTYYVNEINNTKDFKLIENPFELEMAQDAEKIVDAFVGNLKDIVQIEEADGKTMYTANLTETQVPVLVNSISSFILKYSIMDNYRAKDIPKIKNDIYVKDASAKVVENRDGIVENGICSATILGLDENNVQHTYKVEISGNITGINSTTVTEPDLSGEKVEYTKENRNEFDESNIGLYKNDIVKKENNTFVKIGERTIEIKTAENGFITGKYYETYKEGFVPEEVKSFEFTGEPSDENDTIISYTDSDGTQKNGILNKNGRMSQNIRLDTEIVRLDRGYKITHSDDNFDSEFIRVYE